MDPVVVVLVLVVIAFALVMLYLRSEFTVSETRLEEVEERHVVLARDDRMAVEYMRDTGVRAGRVYTSGSELRGLTGPGLVIHVVGRQTKGPEVRLLEAHGAEVKHWLRRCMKCGRMSFWQADWDHHVEGHAVEAG